jgi:undecaprenyl diphosphate synthase
MDYLEEFFRKEIDYLDSVGTRIVVSGDFSRIREQTRKVCYDAINRTKNNSTWFINVCLNYGGRDELVRAAKKVAVDYKEASWRSRISMNQPSRITLGQRTSGCRSDDPHLGRERLSAITCFIKTLTPNLFSPR